VIQARYYYDLGGPNPERPNEHPQLVMRRLSVELEFKILDAVPQSIADCWWFWIEFEKKPSFPSYITEASWLPIGTV
jgi:hypothetical protein